MAGWMEFFLAVTVFLLSHAIPVRPPVKPWLVARLGQRGFTIGYSFLSTAILVWLIIAAGRAPHVELWPTQPWMVLAAKVIMLEVCVLMALAIGAPNPFSFGGSRRKPFDPAHPGLVRYMRHPLLIGMALWALTHVMANGGVAHVVLFGFFAAFALMGGGIINRRKRREMGDAYDPLLAQARAADPRALWPSLRGPLLRIGIGVLVWVALLHLHGPIIGAYI